VASMENLFAAGSKVRTLAERYPGALTSHALSQMRTTLIHQDRPNTLAPVGVAYCRQHLLRKATGPCSGNCSLLHMGWTSC
jgi:hypothetical protein